MIISFMSLKGGSGKSALARNLAIGLLQENKKLKVLDNDYQETLTMFDLKRKKLKVKVEQLNLIHSKNKEELKKIINNHNEKEYLIIDTPGVDSDVNQILLLVSDLVIIPVSDMQDEIFSLHKFLEIINNLETKSNRTINFKIVLNKIHPRTKKGIEDFKDYLKSSNIPFFNSVIRYRKTDFNDSFMSGMGVIEVGKENAKNELKDLLNEILNK